MRARLRASPRRRRGAQRAVRALVAVAMGAVVRARFGAVLAPPATATRLATSLTRGRVTPRPALHPRCVVWCTLPPTSTHGPTARASACRSHAQCSYCPLRGGPTAPLCLDTTEVASDGSTLPVTVQNESLSKSSQADALTEIRLFLQKDSTCVPSFLPN